MPRPIFPHLEDYLQDTILLDRHLSLSQSIEQSKDTQIQRLNWVDRRLSEAQMGLTGQWPIGPAPIRQ